MPMLTHRLMVVLVYAYISAYIYMLHTCEYKQPCIYALYINYGVDWKQTGHMLSQKRRDAIFSPLKSMQNLLAKIEKLKCAHLISLYVDASPCMSN